MIESNNLLHSIKEVPKDKKLIIFDLDGTLAESKSSIDEEMATLVGRLIEKKQVAVIGGGKYVLFQNQFLQNLSLGKELLKKIFLFPTSGASFYRHNGQDWELVYVEKLSEEEKKIIFEAFEKTFKDLNYSHPEKTYGKIIEDRGTQITFSAMGQEASVQEKERWNKEKSTERLKLLKVLQRFLPDLEVRAGGLTSIDVTRKGIDKEYGIRQIKKHLGIDFDEMLFVGDALFPDGNDSAVLRVGVLCFQTKGPEDTKNLIKHLIKD